MNFATRSNSRQLNTLNQICKYSDCDAKVVQYQSHHFVGDIVKLVSRRTTQNVLFSTDMMRRYLKQFYSSLFFVR